MPNYFLIPLQTSGDCDFENSQCGWQAIPSGLYIWQRQLARDAPASIAPGNDHTTLSPAGYYMYVDQTQGTFGLAAVLQSPSLLGNTGTRLVLDRPMSLFSRLAMNKDNSSLSFFSISGN